MNNKEHISKKDKNTRIKIVVLTFEERHSEKSEVTVINNVGFN